MMLNLLEKLNVKATRFSFGATSAIITNLAIITGLGTVNNAKLGIIGGLLVIAIADNISDTLGIHIYKEAEIANTKEIFLTTFINFFTRLLVSLMFVLIILLFPFNTAVYLSIIYDFLILSAISFIIAKNQRVDPIKAIVVHITIAIIVIIASNYLGKIISSRFSG